MDSETVGACTDNCLTPPGNAGRRFSWQRLGIPLLLILCGCQPAQAASTAQSMALEPNEKSDASRLWMTIGDRRFAITLTDNEATRKFAAMLPLTLDMEELNGNEKKKELPDALPTNESQPDTIRNGDLLLWGSRTLVIFYQTFESTYSYTRLGRVDDPTGLDQALGRGDIKVVFSMDQRAVTE